MNTEQEKKKINQLINELLKQGNQLKGGVAITAGGSGSEVAVRVNGISSSLRVKAGNSIEAGKQVLVAFDERNKPLIAINPNPPVPGSPTIIEEKESRRPPKPNDKKESAIVPILVSKTVGEALEERPECTCTHYAIAKPNDTRAFSYETCDGTTPGAAKDRNGVIGSDNREYVLYWSSWQTTLGGMLTPWVSSAPACGETRIPPDPDVAIYGSRQQEIPLHSGNYYSAPNMYLVQKTILEGYFGEPVPEISLLPEVQENMWGFHLVADEQPIVTPTGRKYSSRPTTISDPQLISPITAIANAAAWKYSSSFFGGVVRLISQSPSFNHNGWQVFFGEPIEKWYHPDGSPAPIGEGIMEVGVRLFSVSLWNYSSQWKLMVDTNLCPSNPLLEELLNTPPTDPEDPSKYLMTKWFVGGVTGQWLELPVTHRADDPHFGLISCNSEEKKIWVSIKTGLDTLNTFSEKTEWFEDPTEIIDFDGFTEAYSDVLNKKKNLGATLLVKDNYLFPSDEILSPVHNDYLYSNIVAQLLNQGGRFCKIKLIEINISDSGSLSIGNINEYSYENNSLIPENPKNPKTNAMNSFLAFLGNNFLSQRFVNEVGIDSDFKIFSTFDLQVENQNSQIRLSGDPRKTTPFLSGSRNFFPPNQGIQSTSSTKRKPNNYWSLYDRLKISKKNKKELFSVNGIYEKWGTIGQTKDASRNFIFTVGPFVFFPTNILGILDRTAFRIDGFLGEGLVSGESLFSADELISLIQDEKQILLLRQFGRINNCSRQINNQWDYSATDLPFWTKEDIDFFFKNNNLLTVSEFQEKTSTSSAKRLLFEEKTQIYTIWPYDVAVAANIDKGKLCCFDFMYGNKPENIPIVDESIPDFSFFRTVVNALAFSVEPFLCNVYICEFDQNDDLKNNNIYAGKVANALVYPFDYTEGEPCSFTVWGAAPALMKLKKS